MQKSKPLSLRRNFSWTFIGNGIYAACQWGMLVVLAKLGSPEMVGQFTLGLAVTTPVIMFTKLHLRSIQATDAKQEFSFNDYLGLRLLSTVLALVIITAIVLTSGYHRETLIVVLLIGLAKSLDAISDLFYGLIQQKERMDRIAVSLMLKGPLSLLMLSIGVYISNSIIWGVVGLIFAWGTVLVGYDIRSGVLMLNQMPQPRWHSKTLLKIVRLALPLGFVMMLISLNTNIPRYFIEQHLGERELGIFAALAYLMVVGNMIIAALGDSATPRLAKYYALGDSKAFGTLLIKLSGIGALLGGIGILIAIFAGSQILSTIYSAEYAEHTNLFVWLMVAAGISYIESFLSYGITAARYFRIQMPLFSLVTGATFLACTFLIPTRGLYGAAIALITGSIVRSIGTSSVLIHAFYKLKKIRVARKL